ncbi:MAG: ROK family protein [Ferruginibacter sp.]
MKKFIGIEIGGTKLQIVSGDEEARIDQRFYYTVDRAKGAAGILDQIREALNFWKNGEIAAIGVGFGGPVDRHLNAVYTSHHIEGWSGFPLAGWLTRLTGAPAVIENDANVAALGEAIYGAGSGREIVFYVTLGSGVGGGLVTGQKIYHGITPGETEFGHIRLDKSGRILESSCSGWAINEKIIKAAASHPESKLADLAKEVPGAEAKILIRAIEQQDLSALHIFEETIDDLALGLSHVVHLFHPAVIILGGGFSHTGEMLRKAVSDRLDHYIMNAFKPGPDILLAALKENAVPVGSLVLARQHSIV